MENSTNNDSVSKPPAYISDDLKWSILVNLPSKSLMQFNCVSRLFKSIICNPVFVKEYSLNGGSFKGVLITDFVYYYQKELDPSGDGRNRVFYADYNADNCDSCNSVSYYFRYFWDLTRFTGATAIVKGLIGLYKDECFTLCNVTTREMVELPRNDREEYYNYHLGFDPVREVYKVLKVYFRDEETNVLDAQVFTVGGGSDLAWRSIHAVPADCDTHSVCIGGRLYWVPAGDGSFEPSLIAFDLGSESFETIPIPYISTVCANVGEISGRPALALFSSSEDSWVMKNGEREGLDTWTMHRFRCPLDDLLLAGTLPTGEMLISWIRVVNHPLWFLKYEHDKKRMKLIRLRSRSQLHQLKDGDVMQMYYHEENIVSLGPLLNMQPQ